MNTGREERLERLFEAVADLQPAERAAYLRREGVTADESDDLEELESLLAADGRAGDFLDVPACESDSARIALEPVRMPVVGESIGAYTIERVIASGGMGTVYEARQEAPQRRVALKVMRAGASTAASLRRFQYESELLGRLEHPGIARIYEAGVWEGDRDDGGGVLPYFALEYVPGAAPITAFAEAAALPLRDRLELFARVADAVQHGHQRGIIHRDLKPANVLVDEAGDPKVIDFGIARATDADVTRATLETGTGQLLGTLQYMSPEQCDADPRDIDTRSDVYSLGLVLYELVCGERAYDLGGRSIPQSVDVIRSVEPRPPSAVRAVVRGDLETIVLKAIDKDRERRYPSAADLAADVRRFLDGRPIEAKRDSGWYVLTKTLKRNRVPVAGVALVFLVVLVALAVTLDAWRDADAAKKTAEESLVDVARARDGFRGEAEKYKATSDFMRRVLLSVHPNAAQGRDTELLRELFDDAVVRVDAELAAHPLARADMLESIGASYLALAEFGRAEAALTTALEDYRAALPHDDPRVIQAMSDLAHAYLSLYRLDEAEALLREALELVEQHERAGRPRDVNAIDRTELLTNLAVLYSERGLLEEAEALQREALDAFRTAEGADSYDALRTAYNLAAVLIARGQPDEAEEIYREALDASQRSQGERAPVTLSLLHGLVQALIARGALDDALPLAREAIALHEIVYGGEHRETLLARTSLALALEELGRWVEAEPIRSACAAAAGTLGERDELRWSLRRSHARCLTVLRRLREAEQVVVDAHAELTSVFGAEHPDTLQAGQDLAGVQEVIRRVEGASDASR